MPLTMVSNQALEVSTREEADSFVHYLSELALDKRGRMAVFMQLSRLEPKHRTEERFKLLFDSIEYTCSGNEYNIFRLPSGDILVITKGVQRDDLESIVARIRNLFSDDILFSGNQTTPFFVWYDLTTEYRALLELASRLKRGAYATISRLTEDKKKALQAKEGKPIKTGSINDGAKTHANHKESIQTTRPLNDNGNSSLLAPMDVLSMQRFIEALNTVNIANFLRQQSVALRGTQGNYQVVYSEITLAAGEIKNKIIPSIDLFGESLIFQYLTGFLDKLMIKHIESDPAIMMHKAVGLNINTNSLLSPGFLKIERKIDPKMKKKIFFEVSPLDIFSDVGAFSFARNTFRERGYRFCLDNLTPTSLNMIDRERFGVDIIKLQWSSEILRDMTGRFRESIIADIQAARASRVILSRCDSKEAINFGVSVGVSMFQGFYVDQILTGQAEPI